MAISHFSYDQFNRLEEVFGGASGDRVRQIPDFDDIGRLSGLVTNPQGTADDLTTGFTYNPASQIDARTRDNAAYLYDDQSPGTTSYTPNGLNR